ncbi:methyltransferase domain-containing protein [Actinoplanes sp. NPDC026670]|uniref:class I SAM-dependent methyltransferase n=1 Tax=Actinoplanes sp. NPDC026670 TaxID=3154700 RepID=UPI0033C78716
MKARRVWDKAASSYDRQIALPERFWFGGGREWLGARVEGRVLDVGVGTGRNLPHFPASVTVTGVDVSPGMLAVARQRATDLGRSVDLQVADAARLPFADGSFDTVVCALSLCAIADPQTTVSEMWRVLTSDGRLLLFDHVASTWPPIYALQWLVERLSIPSAGEHFTRRQLPLVRAAGFTVTETVRRKAGTIELVDARKPRFVMVRGCV